MSNRLSILVAPIPWPAKQFMVRVFAHQACPPTSLLQDTVRCLTMWGTPNVTSKQQPPPASRLQNTKGLQFQQCQEHPMVWEEKVWEHLGGAARPVIIIIIIMRGDSLSTSTTRISSPRKWLFSWNFHLHSYHWYHSQKYVRRNRTTKMLFGNDHDRNDFWPETCFAVLTFSVNYIILISLYDNHHHHSHCHHVICSREVSRFKVCS